MIAGRTMAEEEAIANAGEVTPKDAVAYKHGLVQLGRLDARGMMVRRPDKWVEIPSRHNDLPPAASELYLEGFREERRRKVKNEVIQREG